MVFVHGGGNVAGAGSRYDLWNVADRGFVAVSINYRLGALGFLALSALSDEGEGGASGNYGLRDILLSLEWVQSNIASFGGDPARVVLVGHGSGATNVLGLAISPLSKSQMDPACVHARVCAKLFSGIVLLSAGPRIDTPRKQAEAENEVFALTAGCTQPTAAEQVQCLRGLDVKVVQRFFPSYKWDPSENPERNQNDLPVKGARSLGLVIVDGAVIAQDSWTAVQKSGKVSMLADVPVMAMLMSEESDAKPPHKIASWDQFRKVVSERLDSFGTFWDPSVPNDPAKSFTQQAFKLYHTALYKDPQLAYEAMTTDMRLTCSTKKLLNMMSSATTQNIYMGINHLRLEEPVAVVSLSSDGVRSASVGGLEGIFFGGGVLVLAGLSSTVGPCQRESSVRDRGVCGVDPC
jgi:carboxylesterase type B